MSAKIEREALLGGANFLPRLADPTLIVEQIRKPLLQLPTPPLPAGSTDDCAATHASIGSQRDVARTLVDSGVTLLETVVLRWGSQVEGASMRRAEQVRASHLITVLVLASVLFVLTALLPLLTTSASAADVTIENAGFEEPAASPGRAGYFEQIPGWTRSQGERLELQNGVFGWTAAEGNQWIELDGFENNGIYQDVHTTPGHRYLLAFHYSPRPGVFARPPGLTADTNKLQVFWNGKRVKTVARDGSGAQTTWQQVVLSVRATKASTRLEFRGAGRSDSYGAFLDDVQLSDEGPAPASTGVTRTVKAPASGRAKTPRVPVKKKGRRGTVTVSGDEGLWTAVAAVERERLKKRKKKLENLCYLAVGVGIQQDMAMNPAAVFDLGPIATRTAKSCAEILERVQKRIDELEEDRATQAMAQNEPACRVFRLRLRAEKKGGKWVTRVVKKGIKPRLRVTCTATEEGLQLNLRARGKRTLRKAVGKKLKLTLRRSDSAPAPPPGARITITFTQN